MQIKHFLLAGIPFLFSQTTVLAQTDTTRYTFALPSLRVTPDARFSGLCNVGIAMPADANSMHFNASNLVFSEQKFNIGLSYAPNLKSIDQFFNYFSLYGKIKEKTAIGASVRFNSLGSVDSAVQNQATGLIEKQLNREVALNLSLARRFGKNLSAAASIKYVYSNLGSWKDSTGRFILHPANAMAMDLSLTYQNIFKIAERNAEFRVGAAATNIGTKINYASNSNGSGALLPANFGVGLSFVFHVTDKHQISIASDFNKLLVPSIQATTDADSNGVADYMEQSVLNALVKSFSDSRDGWKGELSEIIYSVGVEYWYSKRFSFRLGHQGFDMLTGLKNRLAAGLGARFSVFTINGSFAKEINPTSDNIGTVNVSVLLDLSNLGRKASSPKSSTGKTTFKNSMPAKGWAF